jgi:hypothetical protein
MPEYKEFKGMKIVGSQKSGVRYPSVIPVFLKTKSILMASYFSKK